MTVAVIGSGFAGVAAGHGLRRVGREAVLYDAAGQWGGHTRTTVFDGCVFDEGPHISFTKDERVQAVFAEGAGEVHHLSARIGNWFEGHWVKHPAQVNLHGLDVDLVTDCITDFVAAQAAPPHVEHYGDWLVAMYGRTFAERFPYRYTRKYWTVEPHELGTDWIGSRMYPPKIDEVVRGALRPQDSAQFHYVSKYRYPKSGGYQAFMSGMVEGLDIRTSHEVVGVDAGRRRLRFSDGTTVAFEHLVSTMPLDQLVPRIEGVAVPSEVSAAAERLLCSSVVLVDIGVDRADLCDYDWFYVYDEDIAVARVHFPHRLSPQNVPEGTGSIQAEVYFSRHRPLAGTPEEVGEQAVADLVRMGVLSSVDEPRFVRTRTLRYANVVFDHERQPALDSILPFIAEQGIHLAGRFGEWGYHWTDDATNAGWRAAAAVAGTTVDELLGRPAPD